MIANGVLTCGWKVTGAESFRLASSKLLGFYGTNLQNNTESLMSCVVPAPGNIFIQPDQAGAEALVVAHECRAGRFRKLFDLGIKPHSYMALQLFTDRFRGSYESSRYKAIDPGDLANLPESKELLNKVKHSPREYFLGKKTIHCLTPDHEVLTKSGWKLISTVKPFEQIAVCTMPDRKIFFETPIKWNTGNFDGHVHHWDYPQLDLLVTPDHKLPFKTGYSDQIIAKTSVEGRKFKNYKIPVSGYYSGDFFVDEYIARLIVAIQADGSFNFNTIRFGFRREHKINRIVQLLKLADRSFTFKRDSEGIMRITIHNAQDLQGLMGHQKRFGPWLLDWTAESLDWFIDELSYWDGHYHEDYCNKQEIYFSSIKSNAEWVKTILHLRGMGGSFRELPQGMFSVGINHREFSNVHGADVIPFKGPVYCPTVSSGYFLVRRNNKIAISHNSFNYDEGPQTFRVTTLEESEGTIVLSFKESKEFKAVWSNTFPEVIEWQARIQGELAATRVLRNLFGYPRGFNRLWNDELIRQGLAFVPQSTVGCLTHIAYTELFWRIRKERLPWKLRNNKHDSLLLECPEGDKEQGMAYCKQHMGRLLKSSKGEEYRMKVGISVGYNWGHYDEKTNPEGLREL